MAKINLGKKIQSLVKKSGIKGHLKKTANAAWKGAGRAAKPYARQAKKMAIHAGKQAINRAGQAAVRAIASRVG